METKRPPTNRSLDLCLNCGASLSGPYCAQCGQEATKPLRPLTAMVRELVEDLASLDAKIFLTLRQLLFSPGVATSNYVAGKRATYTPPLRLYIISSAIIIALMSFTGFSSLDSLLAEAPPDQLEALQRATGVRDLSDPELVEKFNARFSTLFPLFNLITPFGLALAFKVVIPRTLFHAHLIAALHLATAQVIYGSLLIPVTRFGQRAQLIGVGIAALVIAIYLWKMLRRVYGGSIARVIFRFASLGVTYVALTALISSLTLGVVLASL